jgi:uncharacterized membrane protein
MTTLMQSLHTLLRHRWRDESVARRTLPPEAMERLKQRVAASERRHTGQIRIAVEAGLPPSYLWRHIRKGVPLRQIVRERAVMLFGKLRVWDTERNNGVLIYLLLADQAIELVADRGLNPFVSSAEWQAMVARMRQAFQAGRFEDGLTQALEEVSSVLVAHFPRDDRESSSDARANELPDAPVLI